MTKATCPVCGSECKFEDMMRVLGAEMTTPSGLNEIGRYMADLHRIAIEQKKIIEKAKEILRKGPSYLKMEAMLYELFDL